MRAIGGNPEAARRLGIPIVRYMLVVMFVAGGVAGLAGMAEVAAIQGRLVSELSPGYGFIGFLVSWLAGTSAGGHRRRCRFCSPLISSVGDILQITQGAALRGHQYSDGRHPVHRARAPTGGEHGAMNTAIARRRSRQLDPVGNVASLCHARRNRRRARRHRQSRPRRHHADRRGDRFCRDGTDRLRPISASPRPRWPARPPT